MCGLLYKIQSFDVGLWPLFDPKCRVVFLIPSINKMKCFWFYAVWSRKSQYGFFRCASSSGGLCLYLNYYRLRKELCFLVLHNYSVVGSCWSFYVCGGSCCSRFECEFMLEQRQMQWIGFLWDSNWLWIGFYGSGISHSIEFDGGNLCGRSCPIGGKHEQHKYVFKSWFCGVWTTDGISLFSHEVIKSEYQFFGVYRLATSTMMSCNNWCTIIFIMLTDLEGLITSSWLLISGFGTRVSGY